MSTATLPSRNAWTLPVRLPSDSTAVTANQLRDEVPDGAFIQLAQNTCRIWADHKQEYLREAMSLLGITLVPSLKSVTTLTSKIGAYCTAFSEYYDTLLALNSAGATVSPIVAYDQMVSLVNHDSCNSHAIATYLEYPNSQHVDVLLGCMADTGFELPPHLVHCMVGLLHSKEERIVNCAALALLSGGDYSSSQLYDAIEKQNLTHVKSFMRAYCELV